MLSPAELMDLPTRRGRVDGASPLLHRLEAFVRLTAEETDLVHGLSVRRRYAAGDDIVAEGQVGRSVEVIVSGWAARQRVLTDGRRQIVNFCLPGDFLGAPIQPDCTAPIPTVAVTPVDTVDASALRDAVAGDDPRYMGLKRVCALIVAMDQALMVDHIVRLGRLTAYQRTCHLLLELHARLDLAGVLAGWRFQMPLTQESLADNLGLSIVHVNRTLQQLRREKMIELKAGWVTILQPETLIAMTDFKLPAAAAA